MAINIPILTEFDSKGLQSAQGAFNNFKTKVGEADGAMGKFKAGGTAALDAVKANAGTFAMAAGAAIAGFAVKAIGDFQKLALEVDKFSNASGLAAEEASRWVEVAGDIGVESGTLITAFNKLNKAAADNSKAFGQLGVEIATTASGATDVNKTFLTTVEALRKVEDPAKRAQLATQLLGKSWTEVSELIEMGSVELETALASVSDQKIIDEEEIRKAKELRAAQDALGDAFQEAALTLGEALIPALTATLKALTPVLEAMKLMGGTLQTGLAETFTKLQATGKSLSDIARELGADNEQSFTYMAKVLGITLDDLYAQLDRDLVPETYLLERAWKQGARAMIDARTASDDLTDALKTVDEALAELKGEIDERQAWRNLIDTIENAGEAALEAFAEKTPESLRRSQAALDDARLEVAEYIAKIDSIPEDQRTQFIAALDQANIDQVKKILDEAAYARTVAYLPTVSGMPVMPGDTPSESTGRRPAAPAPIRIPRPGSAGAGPRSVVVNVGGSVISENDLVETVRKGLVNAQRNGAGLVYTNK